MLHETDIDARHDPAPTAHQCGAVIYRLCPKGIRILIITSLATKRWILPKGWPMVDRTDMEIARIEAWEETGLTTVLSDPFECGSYVYAKRLKNGSVISARVVNFAFETDSLAKKFPEKGRRKRKWVSIKRAKARLKNDEISEMLDALKRQLGSCKPQKR